MSNIEERVKRVIVETLSVEPEKVKKDANFVQDFGADSLDSVDLVMAFEDEFGLEIPDEIAEKLSTVQEVIEHVEAAVTEETSS